MGLFDLFSNDVADQAADLANARAQMGYSQLSDLYGQGRTALTDNANKAVGIYEDLRGKYGAGADAYADASGANGVEGLKRAQETFKNSGQYGVYGFGLDQGLQALNRTHAAAGNPASGNADADTLKFATGLAGNAWGQFQSGLQPYLGAYGTAGTGEANVYTGLGSGLNTSFQTQGNAANATENTIGKNLAAAELNNYNIGANQLGAITGAVQLAMGMPPTSWGNIGRSGGSSGGGGGSSNPNYWGNLFNSFGGGGGGAGSGYSFDGSSVDPSLVTWA